jgi:hypothetical protein
MKTGDFWEDFGETIFLAVVFIVVMFLLYWRYN